MNKIDELACYISEFNLIYKNYAKSKNITYTKLAILYSAYYDEFACQKNICKTFALPKQTVNNEVVLMIRENLISYVESTENKKIKYIVLTDKGKEKANNILPDLSKIENYTINKLSEEFINDITVKLKKLVETLKEKMDEII